MRAVRDLRHLILPLAIVGAAACETPPADGGEGREALIIGVANASATIGIGTDISVRAVEADGSPGSGTVTAAVDPEAAAVGGIATGDDVPAETAVVTLDGDGRGSFKFSCDSEGEADVTFEGATGTVTTTIRCAPPPDPRTINTNTAECIQLLQADGESICRVGITVVPAAADLRLRATVEVDVGGAAILSQEANSTAAADVNLAPTDEAGQTGLFVRSIDINVLQNATITLRDAAGNERVFTLAIGAIQDRASLEMSADPANLSAGGQTTVTVTATKLNTTAAAGKVVRIDIPAGITVAPGSQCLTNGQALLDANGTCAFSLIMPADITETAELAVVATYLPLDTPLVDIATRDATVDLTVNPSGINVIDIKASPTRIRADREPSVSVVSVEITLNGNPVIDATVSVEVESSSAGVIAIQGAATATPPDGLATFNIVPVAALARGVGTLLVTVVQNGTPLLDKPAEVKITVDRDPVLKSIEPIAPGLAVIGVPGGPIPSVTTQQFVLKNEEGQPVPNVGVLFETRSSVPGVTVIPFDESDAAGIVTTVVSAGNVAGPITVVARARDVVGFSAPIVVVGGVPNSSYSSLKCNTIAQKDPFTAACTVQLADKFTNVVQNALNVQFRAEGGNIQPNATANGGAATSLYSFSQPGPGSADVRQWSHSPLTNAPNIVRTTFPGCFDNTTRTPCDLLALCSPAANDPNRATFEAFCPLPRLVASAALCSSSISSTTRQALADERANQADWELEFFFPALNPLAAVDVTAQASAYFAEHRACGFPVGCFIGDQDGLAFDPTDNCPVNPGCFDYSSATECPQNGLIDILAAVRGEEAFDDLNGNGVRDNNEDFVDFPEPFLDKNSSCSFDDLNGNARLTASQKVQLSDLFIDSDPNDGFFGFVQSGIRRETNGTFDTDTELSLKTSIVRLGQGFLQFGLRETNVAACFNAAGVAQSRNCGGNGSVFDRDPTNGVSVPTSVCTETARGEALLEGCTNPENFRDGDSITLSFRWTDADGNCPSNDFSGSPTVATEGPVILVADDSALSAAECGALPGGINAANPERVWCEEHPNMGSLIRSFNLTADCAGEEGTQPVKVTFALDGNTAVRSLTVNCPVCGDNVKEGDEQCDGTDTPPGETCAGDCTLETN